MMAIDAVEGGHGVPQPVGRRVGITVHRRQRAECCGAADGGSFASMKSHRSPFRTERADWYGRKEATWDGNGFMGLSPLPLGEG